MSKADEVSAAGRRKAQALLSRTKQQDAERMDIRDKERQAQDAKIARLRELRLAKEAADKAGQLAAEQTRVVRRKPTAKASG
jgi:hypothetical protein